MSGRPEENRELRSQKTWELKNIVLSGLEKKHPPPLSHRIFSGSTQLTLQPVEMSWIQTDRHKHRCMSWVNFIHSAEDSPTQSVWQCNCFPENNVFWMLEKLSPSYVHRTGWAWRCLISGSYAEVDHHVGMVRQRNIKDWVYGIYWSQKNLWTQWILRAEWRSYGRKSLSTVLDLIHCRANRSYSHTMKGWFMGLSHSIYRKMTSVGKG